MSNPKTYVLLSFDELNEKGLVKLKKAIATSGFEIAKITAAGAARKKDGVLTKTFSLTGMDEQVMTVQVNDSGDISGLKLNGKNVPFTHVTTIPDLGRQLAGLFKKGSTAFQKALARKMARAATSKDDSPQPKRGVKSSVQLLAEVRQQRDAYKAGIAETQAKAEQLTRDADAAQKSADSLQTELNQEQAITRQLKEQIAQLEEAAE
ncbi:hypothetical protein ABEG45_23085 [Pantoea agglomerans]|uniref:defense against restriction DarA-related protein n=1 Tax=Enterobacter agglomerans TaxID=549 RepID=UPI003208BAD4